MVANIGSEGNNRQIAAASAKRNADATVGVVVVAQKKPREWTPRYRDQV